MSNLRRYYSSGQVYFVTCVTYNREPRLAADAGLFWVALNDLCSAYCLDLQAWVILPDHFHLLLDPKTASLSDIMRRLKIRTAALHRQQAGERRGRYWQNRFWDHIIRDEQDWRRHVDYIHFNPVKHRLAKNAVDYGQSSVHEFLRNGYEIPNWESVESDEEEFGE